MPQDPIVSDTLATPDPADAGAVGEFVANAHPVDVAAFLQGFEIADAERCLLAVPAARAAQVFGYLREDAQVALAARLPRQRLSDIVSEMDADDRADLFNRLPGEQQRALLPGLAQAEREDIRRLAGQREGVAGALMTSDYVSLAPGLSAGDAIDVLRREAPDKETIYRAYVVDRSRRLLGSVRLRDLILAPPERVVSELMETTTLAVDVDEDQEEVARKIARYDILALPVVDGDGRLVGIVTHDDATDVLEQEATEDFHRAVTVEPIAGSVRDASFALLYRRRIVWLVLLVFGNLFSGAGIAYFESTIAAHVLLVFFLPLLIGSGGNAGAQSATLMVRALATGDVVLADWARLLGRELVVALALGLTMALAVSGIGLLRGGWMVAAVVAAAMLLIVLVGSVIGVLLPFVLSRLRLDPATASAPLITTLADAIGVVIYFTIATAVLLD